MKVDKRTINLIRNSIKKKFEDEEKFLSKVKSAINTIRNDSSKKEDFQNMIQFLKNSLGYRELNFNEFRQEVPDF